MQKIKTVRYRAKNIGGDRCFARLRYVIGSRFAPEAARKYHVKKFPINVGAQDANSTSNSIYALFGATPNLSTLAAFYQKYRIRGIKLKLTAYYVPIDGDPPICVFTTAQASSGHTDASDPTPLFPTPSIDVTPEQRWTKYRVVANTGAGARPTTLSAYYSVNKVQGPDNVVKNDTDFIGDLNTTAPYWSNTVDSFNDSNRPTRSPWAMFGIFSMDSAKNLSTDMNLTLKMEVTVYTEMFSKRPLIS